MQGITLENIWNCDSDHAKFIRAYLECALWSGIDDNNEHESAIKDAISQCLDFIKLYSVMFNGKSYAEQLTSACGWRTSFPELYIFKQNGALYIEHG